MKRFNYIFRAILAILLINLTTLANAQDFQAENPGETSSAHEPTAWLDSVDISLLTCGPGQEVWSYYGHTALRIEDCAHGNDLAVNWGMFSFNQDYFILRFVFGLTDYQIGIIPMERFIEEYASDGRWVRQQKLALTKEEKMKILDAIAANYKPESRTYRYNFFYDNCTTRARDMIIQHLGQHSTDFKNADTQSTYREEIHRWNKNHRWARFGNDLLLGYMADRPINKKEWEFLPDNLSQDFATEARNDTTRQTEGPFIEAYPSKDRNIKLVDSTFYVIAPQPSITAESELFTPFSTAIAIGLCIFLLSVMEAYKRKNFWWLDAILMLLTGLPGLILLAMVFSDHPTVQINFQILILNPLNLIFIWKSICKMRKGKMYWYYNVWGALLTIFLFMQNWQHYAEGMNILALSLLSRYAIRSYLYDLKLYKKYNIGFQKKLS